MLLLEAVHGDLSIELILEHRILDLRLLQLRLQLRSLLLFLLLLP